MDEAIRKDTLELIRELRRVRTGSIRFLSRALGSIGLSIRQYTALTVLDEKGKITMGALAGGMGLTMGATTNLADLLVDAGYVARDRGTDDRRTVRVQLTEKGKDTLAKAIDLCVTYVAPYMVEGSQEERRTFINAFRKLADRINADQTR